MLVRFRVRASSCASPPDPLASRAGMQGSMMRGRMNSVQLAAQLGAKVVVRAKEKLTEVPPEVLAR